MDHLTVSSQIEGLSYVGIFVLMILSGHLVPVPEEVLLLLIGYAAAIGISNVYITFLFAFPGVVVGDSILFFLSRAGSRYVNKLKNRINPKKLARYEKLMDAHAGKTIFLSRFIITVRFFSPILAGSLNIKWKTFALADFSAAIIYTAVPIFLGYHFHNGILTLVTEVKFARHIIFVLLITVAGMLVSYWAGKKFLKRINGNG